MAMDIVSWYVKKFSQFGIGTPHFVGGGTHDKFRIFVWGFLNFPIIYQSIRKLKKKKKPSNLNKEIIQYHLSKNVIT